MKVLFTTNISSPYRVDFFNELGKLCDLTVLFETDYAKTRISDWAKCKFDHFNGIYMKGIHVGDAEAFCPEILSFLSKHTYDVIVIGMYSSPTGMMAVHYLKSHKIPFVLSSDGGRIKKDNKFVYKIKHYFISSASAWLSTGKCTNRYLEYYGADKKRIYVYPFTSVKKNEILFKPLDRKDKFNYRKQLGMSEKIIVLSVGRFIYIKGYDILLESCKGLREDVGVYIVGGEPTDEYIELKNKYNLSNVHFVGFKDKTELSNYYKAADVFVLPTRSDAWGLVINEAVSFGLPVITTDKCVAGLEMITNDCYGEIIDIEKFKDDFKNAIDRNIKKESKTIIRLAEEYSIEKMAERHIEIFKGLIND